MNIVVVSDTHMPKMAKRLPKPLENELTTADLILHAGDWQTLDVYHIFAKYAPIKGVYGNVDNEEVRNICSYKKLLSYHGFTIGLTHGDGKGKTTEQRAFNVFRGEQLDLLIYGHSHIPIKKEENGTILFNPGSPTDKRRQPFYSFGKLQLTTKGIHIDHVFFDSKG